MCIATSLEVETKKVVLIFINLDEDGQYTGFNM